MKQKLSDVLAIELICPTTVEVGDVVVISDDKEVAAISGAGALTIVGTVCAHKASATVCTVETRFRERRDDRLAGASLCGWSFCVECMQEKLLRMIATHMILLLLLVWLY